VAAGRGDPPSCQPLPRRAAVSSAPGEGDPVDRVPGTPAGDRRLSHHGEVTKARLKPTEVSHLVVLRETQHAGPYGGGPFRLPPGAIDGAAAVPSTAGLRVNHEERNIRPEGNRCDVMGPDPPGLPGTDKDLPGSHIPRCTGGWALDRGLTVDKRHAGRTQHMRSGPACFGDPAEGNPVRSPARTTRP